MKDAIINKAREVRLAYGEVKPPINVEKICHGNNIKVFRIDLSSLEEKTKRPISGLIYVDKQKNDGETEDRRIFINNTDMEARQNFTLAHELGHYLLHIPQDDNGLIISFRGLKNNREYEADIFASEILMPRELVEEEYNKLPFPTASYLARIFKVSKTAMQIKLNEMGLSYIGR